MAEHQEGPEEFDQPPAFFPYDELGDLPSTDLGEPVEVSVEGVFFAESDPNPQRYVLLTDGERRLPILIGLFEATAITVALEDSQSDRPMTHDLMKVLLERMDGRVEKIIIDDVWNKVYYAKIHLNHSGEVSEIDCRPSDAIALALRTESPIFVRQGIMSQGFE